MTEKLRYEVRYTSYNRPYDIKREVVFCETLADALACFIDDVTVLDVEVLLPAEDIEMYLSMYRQDCDPRTPAQIKADEQDADYQDTIASVRP